MLNYLFCNKYYFKKNWQDKCKTNDLEVPKSLPALLFFYNFIVMKLFLKFLIKIVLRWLHPSTQSISWCHLPFVNACHWNQSLHQGPNLLCCCIMHSSSLVLFNSWRSQCDLSPAKHSAVLLLPRLARGGISFWLDISWKLLSVGSS